MSYLFLISSLLVLLQSPPRFAAQTIDDQVMEGTDMAVVDVDGDGRSDILLTDGHRITWYRNGDWKRFLIAEDQDVVYTHIAARNVTATGTVAIAAAARRSGDMLADSLGKTSIRVLTRPRYSTGLWTSREVDGGYPIQAMAWVEVGESEYQLIVLPRGERDTNLNHTGAIRAYEPSTGPESAWSRRLIKQQMPWANHLTVFEDGGREVFHVAGEGGLLGLSFKNERWTLNTANWLARGRTLSAAVLGRVASRHTYAVAAFEPTSMDLLTVYSLRLTDSVFSYNTIGRRVIEHNMYEGRALAMADLLGIQRDQVVAGWGQARQNDQFGIKLYVPFNQYWEAIEVYWIDFKGIDCQKLQLADMDGDGQLDIVALGAATHNVKIYWNQSHRR